MIAKYSLLKLLFISFILIFLSSSFYSCSNRIETDVVNDDLTIQHLPKNENGINAVITFCSKVNQENNQPVNTATKFLISTNEKVYALVALVNRENFHNKLLMFHLEWIGPDGKDIFRKRVDLIGNHSTFILQSAISIPPDKRKQGNYSFRVYLFRELIAEKSFELLNKNEVNLFSDNTFMDDNFNQEIIFCKKMDRKSDEASGVDSVFVIKKKARVTAAFYLNNDSWSLPGEFEFFIEWIGPDKVSFYTKDLYISSDDLPISLQSSISISPKKRIPGVYSVRYYYGYWKIAERNFRLVLK